MNRLLTLPVATLLLCCASVTAAAPAEQQEIPERWTAEEAVTFAIKGNPSSTITLQRIEQAKATAAMVESADYPFINLKAEYGQTNNPMYSFGNILNQGAFNSDIDFNDPGRTDDLQLKAEILYRLYNGGRDKADQRAAQAQIAVSGSDMTQIHQLLGFEVVKTFYAIVQGEKMVEVRKESLEAISASLEVGQARFEAGDLLRQDLLSLELQQSRASENLIISKHNLELAKRSFLNLLGLQHGQVELDEDQGPPQMIPEKIDYRNRYELLRLDAMEQAMVAELDKARGGDLPTVDAFASYQLDKGWILDGDGDSWMAGLRVNYTLFDGHRTSSDIAISTSKLRELEALRKKTELALGLEIQQAQLDYEQASERLEVTGKMVGVAEEVARLSRARFKEGVILASDLIDFEMRLSDARVRQLSAQAGYRVAIANLRRAAGHEQFADSEPLTQEKTK
jgi:outer membrane protein